MHTAENVTKLPETEHLEDEDCCICLDPVSPGQKKTKCEHAVCTTCAAQLRKPECPTCRAPLTGDFLTTSQKVRIEGKQAQDKRITDISDMLYAHYMEGQDDEDPDAVANARSLTDAFNVFLNDNPEISEASAVRIFDAFTEFYRREKRTNRDLTHLGAIGSFQIIGLDMLENPFKTYTNIYNQFFRTHQ